MKLKLRPWRAGDVLSFDPRSDLAREMRINDWEWAKGPPGPTWTLVQCATASLHERAGDGPVVLGVGGAIEGEGGAWLAWACLSDLHARTWPEAMRCATLAIDHLLKRQDVRWLWAQCRADFPGAERVLRRLGFRPHHIEPAPALGADLVCMLREG